MSDVIGELVGAKARAAVGLVAIWMLSAGGAVASTIELKWDANPEENITGYRVYVGSEPGRYERVIDVGTRTSFALDSAQPGRRYYLAVAAVAGSEVSEKSNEVLAISEGEP